MRYAYLLALIVAITGILAFDYRYQLAWFWRPKRAALYICIGVVFFLAWDIGGIALDVFSTNQAGVSGVHVITPDLPIEEFIFLFFFNYFALCVWRFSCIRTSS